MTDPSTSSVLIPYAEAKALYLAATTRMNAAAEADNLAQTRYRDLCPDQPDRTIEYDHPGFTNGAVTLAPHKATQKLASYHVEQPESAEAFKDHPGYIAFCDEYRHWKATSEAADAEVGMTAANEAWDEALDKQMAAWVTMAVSTVSSHAKLLDKIETCRADTLLTDAPDGASVIMFLDAVTRDMRTPQDRGDAKILDTFARWQAAHAERKALPDGPDIDAREAPFWQVIGDAEEEIRIAPATTPAGVACKLWVCLEHDMALQADERWARAADIAMTPNDEGQDWSVRLILSAIRSLKTMEA